MLSPGCTEKDTSCCMSDKRGTIMKIISLRNFFLFLKNYKMNFFLPVSVLLLTIELESFLSSLFVESLTRLLMRTSSLSSATGPTRIKDWFNILVTKYV